MSLKPSLLKTAGIALNRQVQMVLKNHFKQRVTENPAAKRLAVNRAIKVQVLVVYLSTYQFILYGRLKEFFSELFGVKISLATMKRIMTIAAVKTAPVVEKIKKIDHQFNSCSF